MQCKERVDLLETLRKSRKEASKDKKVGDKPNLNESSHSRPSIIPQTPNASSQNVSSASTVEGTVPPVNYSDFSRAPPPLPRRPVLPSKNSGLPTERSSSTSQLSTMAPPPAPYTTPPTLPVPTIKPSRTPSPDKKGGRVMLTTLRGPKDGKGKPAKSPRPSGSRALTPASSKAAGLAWDTTSRISGQKFGPGIVGGGEGAGLGESQPRVSSGVPAPPQFEGLPPSDKEQSALGGNALVQPRARTPPDLLSGHEPLGPSSFETAQKTSAKAMVNGPPGGTTPASVDLINLDIPTSDTAPKDAKGIQPGGKLPQRAKPSVEYPSYRTEFPPTAPSSRATAEFNARIAHRDETARTTGLPTRQRSPQKKTRPPPPSGLSRRPAANSSSPRISKYDGENGRLISSESNDETASSGIDASNKKRKAPRKPRNDAIPVDPALASPKSKEDESSKSDEPPKTWDERVKYIQKHLPKGVDESAAKQIFNDIVVKGDEVHWGDVAGLEAAKTALKEAVVYPFLRPDLFMGLREPARGMLLFGPPGTGKTMLARAVATESRSTFFAISASSLTSKWLGESEKLVRALFSLAKALAPSIIFVDEIDSLLSSRGGSSEHESTRRIKTEFLIQWSDLQRAAAGKQQSEKEKADGDATRVLVLAATNMPWAIDEAARRRFVRRQYIPLPEAPVRAEQLKTLLGHQKHSLNRQDIQVLVELTDGTFTRALRTGNPAINTNVIVGLLWQ